MPDPAPGRWVGPVRPLGIDGRSATTHLPLGDRTVYRMCRVAGLVDAVVLEGIRKRYKTVEALKGINFNIKAGETFSLLGPNGAGKSTLIEILCTMLRPTEGEAWLNGHSVLAAPDRARKELGVVFQRITLDPFMSAYENLWMHGRLYKVPKDTIRQRIPELLELVDLADRSKEAVSRFSGGMKRRLEIARALLHEPQILLLDEPTVGLDPQSRRVLWDHISRVKEERGMTVLLTTHYMDEADYLSDRIAIIDHGQTIALDTPEALKREIGGDTLELKMTTNPAKAATLLQGLPNVNKVNVEDHTIRLGITDANETIPVLVTELSRRGHRVASLVHRPMTMDDVFMGRTGYVPRDKLKKIKGRTRLARFMRGV